MPPLTWSRPIAILCVTTIALACTTGIAAELSVSCPTSREPSVGCSILFSGPIAPGDSEKLARILQSPPPSSDIFRELILNSPGGDVLEAIKVSEVVRSALLETRNQRSLDFIAGVNLVLAAKPPAKIKMKEYPCVSACFLIFMSGVKRSFSNLDQGKIGLHRPFLDPRIYAQADPGTIATRQAEAMQKVGDMLRREGVPPRLIEEMMRRSSKEIYWMSREDWFVVPDTAPWYEELLIARCNYDPTVESRMVEAAGRGDYRSAEQEMPRMIATAACSRAIILVS